MSKRDFYDVLGVSRTADEKELKSAYRKLAMNNHPDRNPDDEAAAERFREATEAYDVLKDPQKRAAYDQLGHAAFEGAAGGGGGFWGGGGGGGGCPGGGEGARARPLPPPAPPPPPRPRTPPPPPPSP
ncbi:MAG TPA: hypothetical protein DCR05_07920, partial [Alphaproteobacteria bacterium]|nr:hypothetical protein [Alphaproteobacteria bacterium]